MRTDQLDPGPSVECVHCLNCGGSCRPEQDRYCPNCGQSTRQRLPTVLEFFIEFVGNFLAFEAPLWRTLRALLLQPGKLTCAYLAGKRLYYIKPLRLYLSISLVAILAIGATFNLKVDNFAYQEIVVEESYWIIFDFGFIRAGLDRGRFFCENLPAFYCQRLEQKFSHDPGKLWHQAALTVQSLFGKLGTAMFLLLPGFAFIMRIGFWGYPVRYAEHLVFALHLHSFWFLVLALAILVNPVPVLGVLVWFLIPVYGVWAARKVYQGEWLQLALRIGIVSLLYAFLLAFAMIGLLLWALVA